jgi:hypothetical protein
MRRHHITTATILLTGFVSTIFIYFTTQPPAVDPFEEFEGSKRFTRSVEVMGGKMSLVAHDLSKWFSSLWQGQQLAFTVAVITVVIAAGYYLIASGIENNRGEVPGANNKTVPKS